MRDLEITLMSGTPNPTSAERGHCQSKHPYHILEYSPIRISKFFIV